MLSLLSKAPYPVPGQPPYEHPTRCSSCALPLIERRFVASSPSLVSKSSGGDRWSMNGIVLVFRRHRPTPLRHRSCRCRRWQFGHGRPTEPRKPLPTLTLSYCLPAHATAVPKDEHFAGNFGREQHAQTVPAGHARQDAVLRQDRL